MSIPAPRGRHMSQLLRRTNALQIQDGTGCGPRMLSSGQAYAAEDCKAVAAWLVERATGYIELRKFEGGKLYPGTPYLDFKTERACHDGQCCRVARDRIEAANLEAYHGDIDGDSGY